MKNMPNKDLLLRYAELKIQISKIEEELDMIKPSVLTTVATLRGDSDSPIELQEYPGYSFTIKPGKRKWEYTPSTQDMEKKLKEIKKEEEQLGLATADEPEPVLTFNSPRN